MLSLSDRQLDAVMAAARSIRVQDRDKFLRLIAQQLKVKDVDVQDATDRAVRYLTNIKPIR